MFLDESAVFPGRNVRVRQRADTISDMTNPGSIDDVPIGSDMIRLGQFLKFSGLLDSGGDAKEVIIDGYVVVNDEIERRRGRQLRDGDIVRFEGRSVRVRP